MADGKSKTIFPTNCTIQNRTNSKDKKFRIPLIAIEKKKLFIKKKNRQNQKKRF